VAAALCIKPRGLLTANQASKVDALKKDWPELASMRRLAMRFRGVLKSKKAASLGVWLKDVQQSGLYAMQRFARTLQRDIDAVRNAITEPWSNGQTEGQINRLKALKRAMYGRAWARTPPRAHASSVAAPATGSEAEPAPKRFELLTPRFVVKRLRHSQIQGERWRILSGGSAYWGKALVRPSTMPGDPVARV
jgi:hypothetical protein